MAIRHAYGEQGVDGFYRSRGQEYRNPHEEQVRLLLQQNAHRIDYRQALDCCCGSGEVTLALRELGYEIAAATDPFTAEAYRRRSGLSCLPWSFDDLIRGRLDGEFTAIISSFALHLCPPKQLYPLAYQLFRHAPQLVIITPHKRPALEELDRIDLEFSDHALTERGKKVFLKAYRES